MHCAAVGDPESLAVILEANPKLDVTDSSGLNVLHYACKAGQNEMLKILLGIKGIEKL